IQHLLATDPKIDTILLACTHYPLLKEKILQYLPENVRLLSQGEIVADSLQDYLKRHPEIEQRLTKEGKRLFFTTDAVEDFNTKGTQFFEAHVQAQHADI
ncbi:MAG: aspartate/glutamate racemase family protein, partial [Flavisolibacter sp.]|nr:aspartate/glutamate racemase family protein [Flavisolibacter sp.]